LSEPKVWDLSKPQETQLDADAATLS
jgi:hypothetical protein